MLQSVTKIIKFASIPVLLAASLFSPGAGRFQPLMNFVICLGAVIFVLLAARMRKYLWASGFVAVVAVFSPLSLLVKIFLLMCFACIAGFATVLAAFQTQPAAAGRNLSGEEIV